MDVNSVTTLIGSVGFPIVACLGMAWYVKYQTDQNNKEVENMRKEYKEEIQLMRKESKEENQKVTEAINNNTAAMQKLVDKIEMQCGR